MEGMVRIARHGRRAIARMASNVTADKRRVVVAVNRLLFGVGDDGKVTEYRDVRSISTKIRRLHESVHYLFGQRRDR